MLDTLQEVVELCDESFYKQEGSNSLPSGPICGAILLADLCDIDLQTVSLDEFHLIFRMICWCLLRTAVSVMLC